MNGENSIPIHYSGTSCCKSAGKPCINQIVENTMNLNPLCLLMNIPLKKKFKKHMSKPKKETEKY